MTPISVLKKLILLDTHIEWKGQHIDYHEVHSICFVNTKLNDSYMTMLSASSNGERGALFMVSNPVFCLPWKSEDYRVSIVRAYRYLTERTFEERLTRAIDKLNSDGFVCVGGVSISLTGELLDQSNGVSVNLLRAREQDGIGRGHVSTANGHHSTDPNLIWITDTGCRTLGTGLLSFLNGKHRVIKWSGGVDGDLRLPLINSVLHCHGLQMLGSL